MAQFTIYRSTDAGAPVLTGETGKLVALLKACLVDGYGAKAAAGWTEPYTGASKGAFKQGAGCGFYLRVQDDGPGAGTFKEARIRGYETMTDVDSGANLFPTAVQMANGLFVRKSVSADAVARPWVLLADSRTLYFLAQSEVAVRYYAFCFGDFYSYTPGDAYNCLIRGRSSENTPAAEVGDLGKYAVGSTVTPGLYISRSHTGLGGSIQQMISGDRGILTDLGYLTGSIAYPNPADGGLILSPLRFINLTGGAGTYSLRGHHRGFWQFGHPLVSVADGDTVTGTGELAGKTFLFHKEGPDGVELFTFETSNTLDTN